MIPGLAAGQRGASTALSEDGAYLAHAAGGMLTIRRTTDASVADTLTEDAGAPFFSPDGESVAYVRGANIDLTRVSRTGGAPELLAVGTGARMRGGSWGDDGTIVWATTSGLYRVDSEGGDVQVLATPDTVAGELEYNSPELLPGSDAVLFTVVPRGAESGRDASIASLDLETGDITTVLQGGSAPRYVEAGYLVYSVDGSLRAVAFDARRRRTRGEPVDVGIEGVAILDGWGADFDISGDGTLAYQVSTDIFSTLVWRDRDGREEPLGAPPALYGYRRISPDGGRVVYDRRRPGGGSTRDLYIWDVDRRVEVRLTDDPGEEFFGDWTPDGDTIYYSSNRGGGTVSIWRRAANGTGEPELVLTRPSPQMLNDMLPDGTGILIAETNEGRFDLVQMSLGESVSARTLLSTPAHEYNAFVSPDGRFYAYQTDRDGQFEVWVRPLGASADGPVKVSVDGGMDATWSRDGTELFYRARDASVMAARIVTTPRLAVGEVVQLLSPLEPMSFTAVGGRGWDVSPRDGRILWSRRPLPPNAGIRVVLHWEQELLEAMGR
jgi:Tol biopolymer transport system component